MAKLSESARAALNDINRIRQRDLWFERMAHVTSGESDPWNDQYVYTLAGDIISADESLMYTDPEEWMIRSLERAAIFPECKANRFAPLAVEYGTYGVHFIDRIFGANVFFKQDDNAVNNAFQWNVEYLKTPVGSLTMPDLEHDETWQLAKRAALTFIDADVKLPLFGLPVLSSPLNIYINLYGQEGLIAMLDDEEAAKHDLSIITEVIGTLHRWYRAHIPAEQLQPVCSTSRTQIPGSGQLCGCTTQLLSPALYEKFIAPLDDELLAIYPNGGMIHLCGSHAQHIEVFRNMPHLRALQLNDRAAEDLPLYLDGLRSDQILYVSACEGMPKDEIIRLAAKGRVVFVSGGDAPER